MYLDQNLVKLSFDRLICNSQVGKSHLERTSCLMYFLAFDAVCAKVKDSLVDFDGDKELGLINRRLMDSEFTKLILLESSADVYTQVVELGKIEKLGKSPAMRIASNFYSVPLKNAANSSEEYAYPKRPKNPIFKMGNQATGFKWGIAKHPEWKNNLPVLLQLAKSSTPFTDLAIYVLRNNVFSSDAMNCEYYDILSDAIKLRFTFELAEYWSEKIKNERVFAKHIDSLLLASFMPSKILESFTNDIFHAESELAYIHYLEMKLTLNNIPFYKTKFGE